MKLINPNYSFLVRNYQNNNIKGVCLEGSSRSGKSFSAIQFILWYCAYHKGKSINIIRETYNSFKTTLYQDFGNILLKIQSENPFLYVKDIATFNFFDNKINFIGADNPAKFEGAGCDIAWYNEMLDIPKVIFDQQEQRTREFWLADWNPKCTDHYCFNLEKRPDVKFLRTTFKDNPFISIIEKNKILSYEPTPENKAIGTADEYRWKVYGLGERASRTGLVHPNITWISEFPADCEKVGYGMDFGFTNSPSTVVKVGRKGNNLYLQKMFYAPIKDVTQLFEPLRIILNGHYITADCADKYLGSAGFIRDLRGAGFQVIACRKFQGSVKWGIDLINRHKVHIVYDVDFRREAENRVWKEIGGVPLNEPESGNDHLFDAVAYCMQTDFKD